MIDAYNTNTTDPLDELHDIVDKDNKVIGTAKRIDFLKNKNLIRRSCHVWLKNSQGKFWFQKRSRYKDLQPLHWCCSSSGFVAAGAGTQKEILQDAQREMKEELGVQPKIQLKKIYLHQSPIVGGIMVYLYFGQNDGPFQCNRKEIADIQSFDYTYVWNLYKRGRIKLTEPTIDELRFFLKNDKSYLL